MHTQHAEMKVDRREGEKGERGGSRRDCRMAEHVGNLTAYNTLISRRHTHTHTRTLSHADKDKYSDTRAHTIFAAFVKAEGTAQAEGDSRGSGSS